MGSAGGVGGRGSPSYVHDDAMPAYVFHGGGAGRGQFPVSMNKPRHHITESMCM